MVLQNFQEKLDKIKKVRNLWNTRGLYLFGRVTIDKTFLLPKLLYVSSIIEPPTEVIKRMERMIFKFLWKGLDKVTRLSVINSVKNGGLNLTDLETQIKAIRLSWIPRILDCSREGPWKYYLKHFLKLYGGTFLLKYAITNSKISIFHSTVFIQSCLSGGRSSGTHLLISTIQKIIWNNKVIRIDNKTVFYQT